MDNGDSGYLIGVALALLTMSLLSWGFNGPLADPIVNIDTAGTDLGTSFTHEVTSSKGLTRYAFRLQNGTNYEGLNNVYIFGFSTAVDTANTGRVSNGPPGGYASSTSAITILKVAGTVFNKGTVYILTFSEEVSAFTIAIND